MTRFVLTKPAARWMSEHCRGGSRRRAGHPNLRRMRPGVRAAQAWSTQCLLPARLPPTGLGVASSPRFARRDTAARGAPRLAVTPGDAATPRLAATPGDAATPRLAATPGDNAAPGRTAAPDGTSTPGRTATHGRTAAPGGATTPGLTAAAARLSGASTTASTTASGLASTTASTTASGVTSSAVVSGIAFAGIAFAGTAFSGTAFTGFRLACLARTRARATSARSGARTSGAHTASVADLTDNSSPSSAAACPGWGGPASTNRCTGLGAAAQAIAGPVERSFERCRAPALGPLAPLRRPRAGADRARCGHARWAGLARAQRLIGLDRPAEYRATDRRLTSRPTGGAASSRTALIRTTVRTRKG